MNKHAFLCSAALLLPLLAVADSRMQSAAAESAASATARVNFKIVIPTVLYLRLDTETAAIMSNSRNVMLKATVGAPTAISAGAGIVRTPAEMHPARGLILSAAAGKAIVQNAHCAPVAPDAGRILCTASMP